MASASSSSSSSHVKYDVFLSFRGEDTRDGFTSHLNAALYRRNILTFIDDKLERGDEISQSLLYTIESSKISIIIFSKTYASSKWCLEELVKILECRKKNGRIVIPIFYHVDPSDVRKQTGTFGDAFVEHGVRFRERQEMLKRWRNGLTEAADISGFDSKVIRPESELIKKIVEDIFKRLNDMSSSDNKTLVGVTKKILEIKSLLHSRSNKVCKVGIWGMGGIGKTTIANAIFNEISSQFEASYFIPNVREKWEKCELSHLQKELLSKILEDEHPNIRLTSTKERLRCKRLLIVFDDLTNNKQINELIGDFENLGSKSRIIITTRDKQVLKNCGLDDATIYEVKGLCDDESLRLFKQHAFNQNHLMDTDYMELSNRVISYTKGMPLALEVLGSFLLGREKFEWESALEKLESSPHKDIQTVLKISYDGLDVEEKELFLDIACFFEGWDKYLVGIFSSHIGTRVLVDKALITISYGTIRMHDLLQEMGREIVRQESIYVLDRRSRLWHHNDVYHVLEKKMGTNIIRGLCFDMANIKEIHLNPYAFSKMDNLRFLIVDNPFYHKVYGFKGLKFDFTEIRCLSWDDYPCTSLPLKFCPKNLVVLKMQHNNLKQLWSGVKDLAHLKYIDLSYSKHLRKVPDLSEARNLESLILEGCRRLLEITSPSRNLNKLVNLNLRNCESFMSLPIGIPSKSLRDVILSGCSKLETAPRISRNMERLCLDGTAIKELSSSIESPSRLVELNLKNCLSLESLLSNVCNLESLQQLNLSGLSNLKFVLGIPCNIKELYLDRTAIKELSSSIENASSLVRLSLKDCSSLESLPDGICKLKSLRFLCISGCSKLVKLPEDFGNLESLEELEADGVTMRELPSSMARLKNLHGLSLERWSSQQLESLLSPMLSSLHFLRRLNLNRCRLTELPNNVDQLALLRDLELEGNNFQSLPTNIMNLSELRFLNIMFCKRLRSLPKLPRSIEDLWADGCKLLNSLSGLTNLSQRHCGRTLSFSDCVSLNWNALRNLFSDAALDMYSDEFDLFKYEKVAGKPQGFMCFPGSKIPGWFNIQSSGSSIVLPQGSFNHKKFLGFIFCAIVEVEDYDCLYKYFLNVEYELRVKCLDDYMRFDKKLLSVGPTSSKSDHVLLGYNGNTCEFFKFSGDTEAIIIFKPVNIKNKMICGVEKIRKCGVEIIRKCGVKNIKKCGVRLLFSQESEEPMKKLRCSVFDEEEEQEEAYSKGFKSSNFFKGESSSRCSIFNKEEEQEQEEAYSMGFKSSNFFKGKSSSSSGLHLVQHEKEVEEFNPSTNESSRFTSDLNELPQDLVGSTRDVIATTMLSAADNDRRKPKGCRCVIL